MRAFIPTLLIALTAPALASEPPPHAARRKAAHTRAKVERLPDLLPTPGPRPRSPQVTHVPIGEDKTLRFGDVTVTPGGFLNVGTGGPLGRN